ncbi:hypothetical protein AB4144_07480 [Rhizobiaceae sp. 2RAB30]
MFVQRRMPRMGTPNSKADLPQPRNASFSGSDHRPGSALEISGMKHAAKHRHTDRRSTIGVGEEALRYNAAETSP